MPECCHCQAQAEIHARGLCRHCPRDLATCAAYSNPRGRPSTAPRKPCHHCQRVAILRPRGLCHRCYRRPRIRRRYPAFSQYGRRGVGNICGNAPLPSEPTDALPGSAEKIEVLAQRAARHESLWHPLDAFQPSGGTRRERVFKVALGSVI
jgi:hypothetical protein